MRVLVIVVIVVVIVVVTWESKANSSSSLTELQTGTELGNSEKDCVCTAAIVSKKMLTKNRAKRQVKT